MTDHDRGMRQGFLDLLKHYNARLYDTKIKLHKTSDLAFQLTLNGRINEIKQIIQLLETLKNDINKGTYETPSKNKQITP